MPAITLGNTPSLFAATRCSVRTLPLLLPQTCCVNPVQATVKWLKDVHTVSFEVRPPPSAASGIIMGSIDFYVGAMQLGQSHVEMTVVTSSDSAEAADVLGPVTKVGIWVDIRYRDMVLS